MICENDIKCQNHKNYCRDPISNIEGYDEALNDLDHKYVIHHRLETCKRNRKTGKFDIKRDPSEYVDRDTLKAFGLYFNRPANELVYMRYDEHSRLHTSGRGFGTRKDYNKGKRRTKEQKDYLSNLYKGRSWALDPVTGKRHWVDKKEG